MTETIKIITAPDMLFNQAMSILVIQPGEELKKSLEDFLASYEKGINVYLFSENDTDIKWLLTVANHVDYVILDMNNTTEIVNQFTSYLLSITNTYYKTEHMKAPWDLLNQNRFYDFPNIESENE